MKKDSYIIFSEQANSKRLGHNGTTGDYKGNGKNNGHWYCSKKDLQLALKQLEIIPEDDSVFYTSMLDGKEYDDCQIVFRVNDSKQGIIYSRKANIENRGHAAGTTKEFKAKTKRGHWHIMNLTTLKITENDVQTTIIAEHKGSGSSTTGIQYRRSQPSIGFGHLGYKTCTQSSTSKIATSKVRSTV